ncbi:MAG: sodium:proton antiporter [Gammaproteobacteria bacterium]|nr:sodium:proton antiporter [Gammaproteobacteria bacterium]
MTLFQILAVLLALAAVFAFLNQRYLRLPTATGVMTVGLMFSVLVILFGELGIPLDDWARALLRGAKFDQALLHGMLSFLLFAGALHVDLNHLARHKWTIFLLASVGVVLSTLIVGVCSWWVLAWVGAPLPLRWCFLFGALISPTDPIAVLATLKSAGVPANLEAAITGESLFNDGFAFVVFLVTLGAALGGKVPEAHELIDLLLVEVGGGLLLGLLIGSIAYRMISVVSSYHVEVIITLAVVTGAYALADALHLSGPIAVVVAGLLVGDHRRRLTRVDAPRAQLDTFYELGDEILNVILFMLIGLEVLVLPFTWEFLFAGALLIPTALLARLISVGLPIGVLRFTGEFSRGTVQILTWGGLRGGVSVALALSLPAGSQRDLILAGTYAIVLFSILVQGLTLGRLVRYLQRTG